MKYLQKITYILCLFFIMISCQSILDEESISIQTTESYYNTPEGFEDLVKSNYTLLRNIHQTRNLVLQGTDLFTSGSWIEADRGSSGSPLNVFDVRYNSTMGDLGALWTYLYREIGRTNTVISRQDQVQGMDEGLKQVRVAEAKFLRAFAYFYLVQQWGDVPMPLEEITVPSREVIKFPAADIYSQIIGDLEECVTILPDKDETDYGRATKGAAQFLLARVYLTRGWNFNGGLGGSAPDFDKAVQLADEVIARYPLAENYSDLFPQHSENPLQQYTGEQDDKNDEIVFAVQYSDDVNTFGSDPSTSGTAGNDFHSIFGGDAENIPGSIGRTNDYNRHQGHFITTPATYRLFDPDIDTRYLHNFVDAQYALSKVDDFHPDPNNPDLAINIQKGDTVLSFRPWNDPAELSEKGLDAGGTKHFAVLNNDEIGILDQTPYHQQYSTPLMWKFWQPDIPYGDGEGTFDYALFRSAEAYLIASEAILKGGSEGNLGGAEAYYNKVVDRALGPNTDSDPLKAKNPADLGSLEKESYRANGNLTFDMILDERARELMGEYVRWYDLKRTGKLVERTSAMNPWTNRIGQMEDKHYLRPIPQQEIDRSIPAIAQNEGY